MLNVINLKKQNKTKLIVKKGVVNKQGLSNTFPILNMNYLGKVLGSQTNKLKEIFKLT
jgi:hypothetical protein